MSEILMPKLPEYKKIVHFMADQTKTEFSHFMGTLLKEKRVQFLVFQKRLNDQMNFFWIYLGLNNQLKSIRKELQIFLTAHIDKHMWNLVLVDDMSSDGLYNFTIICQNIQPDQLKKQQTDRTCEKCREELVLELKEKELKELKTNVDVHQENLNEETEDNNEVAPIYCRTS